MTTPTIDPPDRASRPTVDESTIVIVEAEQEFGGPSPIERLAAVVLKWPKAAMAWLAAGLRRSLRHAKGALRQADPKRRRRAIAIVGASAAVVIIVASETLFGAVLQARSQQVLAGQFSATLDRAASAAGAGDLSPLPVDPPQVGTAVAVISVPALGLQQVVVEGSSAQVTQHGPGHVPGTSLPGQPGNAAVIGRRTTFGAPFRNLDHLRTGDAITVTTVEGTTRYVVTGAAAASDPFAASNDSRLTLVSSAPPVLASRDLVVTAGLVGNPLPPTPQNPRDYVSPRDGSFHNWAQLLVWSALAVGAIALARLAFRRLGIRARVIWVISVPVVFALLILIVRDLDSFLPATL